MEACPQIRADHVVSTYKYVKHVTNNYKGGNNPRPCSANNGRIRLLQPRTHSLKKISSVKLFYARFKHSDWLKNSSGSQSDCLERTCIKFMLNIIFMGPT